MKRKTKCMKNHTRTELGDVSAHPRGCIIVKNLSKYYKPRCFGIRGLFASHSNKKENIQQNYYVLNNINFVISPGESVGIIGENGSGKSTMLKILSGVTANTSGTYKTYGKVSSLLELGCAFNPEYTGLSNIYLYGTLMGMAKKEIKKIIPKICEFSGIGDKINQPVKTYSDGMFLRLAFAAAISTDPDILIVDEALAVGDFAFRQKCYDKISEMKSSGTTLLLVSHDADVIRRFCHRCIWLKDGRIQCDDKTFITTSKYMQYITGHGTDKLYNQLQVIDYTDKLGSWQNRYGNPGGIIKYVNLSLNQNTGHKYTIKIGLDLSKVKVTQDTAVTVSFKNTYGLDITVISSYNKNIPLRQTADEIEFTYTNRLCQGEYTLAVSVENRGSVPITYYDYIDGSTKIKVTGDSDAFGIYETDFSIKIN